MESSVHTCRHRNGQPSTLDDLLGRTPDEGEIRKSSWTRGTAWFYTLQEFWFSSSITDGGGILNTVITVFCIYSYVGHMNKWKHCLNYCYKTCVLPINPIRISLWKTILKQQSSYRK